MFLYVAKDLPPADETGTADPFVKIRCCGKTAYSSVRYRTLYPRWFEVMEMDISIPFFDESENIANINSGMSVMIYDTDVEKESD